MTKWKSTLEVIGQACVDWAIDTGECHLCETSVRGAHAEAHADGCPVGAYLASTNAVAPRDAVTRPDLSVVPVRAAGVFDEASKDGWICAACRRFSTHVEWKAAEKPIGGSVDPFPCPKCNAGASERRVAGQASVDAFLSSVEVKDE